MSGLAPRVGVGRVKVDKTRFPVALPLTELVDVTGRAWTCRLCQSTAASGDEAQARTDALSHVEDGHYGKSVCPVTRLDGVGPVARYLSGQ